MSDEDGPGESLRMSIGPYLYRGTTAGWPGNSVLQEEQITCTSTDPLVATLLPIECRNHGRAVILAAKRANFDGLLGPANHFSVIESAVNLHVPPLEFARRPKSFWTSTGHWRSCVKWVLRISCSDQGSGELSRDALSQTYGLDID